MEPYVVLGTYKPRIWRAWRVGRDLTEITHNAGLYPHIDPMHGPLKLTRSWYSESLHAEVRRRTFTTDVAEDWHYDGDTTPGSKPDCIMVLWATSTPTEILYNNEIYQPEPFELVAFRNIYTRHRRPTNCDLRRWTFRQRCAPPPIGTMLDLRLPQ